MVKFTHAVTGQGIYCRDAVDIRAVFQAPLKDNGSELTWIVVSGIPSALPLKEDLQTVLGLTQMNKENSNVGTESTK